MSTGMVITREYTYSDNYGIHVVNVRGFNLANNDTVSTSVDVLEWNCSTPNISVDPLFTNQDTPFIALTEDGVNITANFSVDCMKNERFNARWEVLDDNQAVVTTLANASQLAIAPHALPVGSYTVRINATMWSSVFDLTDKAVVRYAYADIEYCHPPNVTLNPFATEVNPFVTLGDDGFTATADFFVDCPPMEQLTAQWDIIDSSQMSILRTVENATQLVISPYNLSPGVYAIRVNTTIYSSLLDLSQKSVISYTYISVTQLLTAGIDGSSYINATFNATVYLSAYNSTYATGQPSSDKSGMVFEWRCKRSNETWPTELPAQSYLPHNGTNGGCFGEVGPGVLGFAAELWSFTIDTGYLEPLVEYNIQFVVWNDKMSATADVSLYVQEPLAPNIFIRSV